MNYRVATTGQKGGVTAANVTVDRGQRSLFDLAEGEKRKERGMAFGRLTRQRALAYLRHKLAQLYQTRWYQGSTGPNGNTGMHAYVTADDARPFLQEFFGGEIPKGGNSFMGSLFKDGNWEPTGQWVKSKVPGNNARRMMAWRHK